MNACALPSRSRRGTALAYLALLAVAACVGSDASKASPPVARVAQALAAQPVIELVRTFDVDPLYSWPAAVYNAVDGRVTLFESGGERYMQIDRNGVVVVPTTALPQPLGGTVDGADVDASTKRIVVALSTTPELVELDPTTFAVVSRRAVTGIVSTIHAVAIRDNGEVYLADSTGPENQVYARGGTAPLRALPKFPSGNDGMAFLQGYEFLVTGDSTDQYALVNAAGIQVTAPGPIGPAGTVVRDASGLLVGSSGLSALKGLGLYLTCNANAALGKCHYLTLKCTANTDCPTSEYASCDLLKGQCVSAVCGDGKREGAEACDDGNTAVGDGCSSGCGVEPLFECAGKTPDICRRLPNGAVTASCVPSALLRGVSEACGSGVCELADSACGLLPGSACTSDNECRGGSGAVKAGLCFAADGLCGLPNGSACNVAAGALDPPICRSTVCNADGKCGDLNGALCTKASTCRSGVCLGGRCGAGPCTADTQCEERAWCDGMAGTCEPDAVNGAQPVRGPRSSGGPIPCTRGAQCASGLCGPDGQCGLPTGGACAQTKECRSAVAACNGAPKTCRTACLSDDATGDSECAGGAWCKSDGAAAFACSVDLPNGDPCVRAGQCQSGVCNRDGSCGQPDSGGCQTSAMCRSGVCDVAAQKCSVTGCLTDVDCPSARWCSAKGAVRGTCLSDGPNGGQPEGPVACTRGAQCLNATCLADGRCGYLNDPASSCGPGKVMCRSEVCSLTDNRCGLKNSEGACSAATAGVVCRSTSCSAADSQCGFANGEGPCASGGRCRSGVCDVVSGKCAACSATAPCPPGSFCDGVESPSAACRPQKPNSETCKAKGDCKSDVCAADGQCGAPDGNACGLPLSCRSASCTEGVCGGKRECIKDADCPPGGTCDLLRRQCVTFGDPTNAEGSLEGGGCTTSGRTPSRGFAFASFLSLVSLAVLRSRARKKETRAPANSKASRL